ncbi:MAG: hypothetical protein HYX53_02540 [Chloroflexi bacterium]|nr:hypothetical protein [Chloroflexota bacterium]
MAVSGNNRAGRGKSGGNGGVLFAGAVIGVVAVLAAGGGGVSNVFSRPVDNAYASDLPAGWEFVNDALASMGTVAIQLCTGETALKAAKAPADQAARQTRLDALSLEYERLSDEYNREVANRRAMGEQRPWDIPAAAPPVSVMRGRACAKLPAFKSEVAASALATFDPNTTNRITLEQLDAAAVAAGWPMQDGWWPQMRLIVQCESGLNTRAHNTSDPNGGSYGLAQLNGRQHFDRSGEDFELRYDPVVNLRTALWLRTVRGRFGGAGGWKNCAEKYGID